MWCVDHTTHSTICSRGEMACPIVMTLSMFVMSRLSQLDFSVHPLCRGWYQRFGFFPVGKTSTKTSYRQEFNDAVKGHHRESPTWLDSASGVRTINTISIINRRPIPFGEKWKCRQLNSFTVVVKCPPQYLVSTKQVYCDLRTQHAPYDWPGRPQSNLTGVFNASNHTTCQLH